MSHSRAPRRQRWRRPGPALAAGERPHLPRSPWRRRALLAGRQWRPRRLPMAPSTTTRRGGTRALHARPRRAAIGSAAASRDWAGPQGARARARRAQRRARGPARLGHEGGCAAAILGPGSRHFVFWRRALSCLKSLQDEEWREICAITLPHAPSEPLEWLGMRSAEVRQCLAGLSLQWCPCSCTALGMRCPVHGPCQFPVWNCVLRHANQVALRNKPFV